ncbi:SPFH domain-containing protein [Nocardioides pyridinolyticus]
MTAATPLVRWVPRGHWVAVVRRGVVRRVRTSGPIWRLPFVERFVEDVVGPSEAPVLARSVTRDGVPVLVLAEATVSFPRPALGTRYADPWPAAEQAAEETIARTVADWSAAEITRAAAVAAQPLRREVRAAVDPHGVQVVDLTLVEVGVSLDGPR